MNLYEKITATILVIGAVLFLWSFVARGKKSVMILGFGIISLGLGVLMAVGAILFHIWGRY
jgi:hypothetical protein